MRLAGRAFSDEVLSDAMAAILRQKSPSERLEMMFAKWRFARDLVRSNVRSMYPDITEDQLRIKVAIRMSHGAVGPDGRPSEKHLSSLVN